MDKFTKTVVSYLSSVALQFVCFFLGRNSLKIYNDSLQYKYWIKIFRPKKPEIIPSSEWFTLDNWSSFKVIYYDFKEFVMFFLLFTITALCYLSLKKEHTLSKTITFILSLLSGYVILYEIIAIVNECIILC